MLLADSALQQALAITGQSQGNVQLVDWQEGFLQIMAHRGFSPKFLATFQRVRSADGCVCGRALLQRRAVVVEDLSEDERFPDLRDIGRYDGFSAVQSTPLISTSGALLGMVSTHGLCRPTNSQLERIAVLARQAANELVRLRVRDVRHAF